jgi:hypothetical protein
MIIKNLFDIGDFVISNTDKKRRKMIVVEIYVGATGLSYGVSYFDNKRTFWEYELEPFVEKIDKRKRGTFRPLTVKYLKSLDYEPYIKLLQANDTETIKEIIEMLAGAEEYEMAEVTKRYLSR